MLLRGNFVRKAVCILSTKLLQSERSTQIRSPNASSKNTWKWQQAPWIWFQTFKCRDILWDFIGYFEYCHLVNGFKIIDSQRNFQNIMPKFLESTVPVVDITHIDVRASACIIQAQHISYMIGHEYLPGSLSSKQTLSYWSRNSHYTPEMVVRPS